MFLPFCRLPPAREHAACPHPSKPGPLLRPETRLRARAGPGGLQRQRVVLAERGDLTTGRLLELLSTRKENDRCTWGKAACQQRGCLGQALGLDPASGLTTAAAGVPVRGRRRCPGPQHCRATPLPRCRQEMVCPSRSWQERRPRLTARHSEHHNSESDKSISLIQRGFTLGAGELVRRTDFDWEFQAAPSVGGSGGLGALHTLRATCTPGRQGSQLTGPRRRVCVHKDLPTRSESGAFPGPRTTLKEGPEPL